MIAIPESDAASKFCPYSRQVFVFPFGIDGNPAGSATSFNRLDDGEAGDACRCLASRCMMWQWTKPPVAPETEDRELETGATPLGKGWAVTDSGTDEPDEPGGKPYHWQNWQRLIPGEEGEGYCGLAGKP